MRRACPPGSQGAGNGAAADERTPPKRTSSGGAGHGGGGSLGGLFAASRLARARSGSSDGEYEGPAALDGRRDTGGGLGGARAYGGGPGGAYHRGAGRYGAHHSELRHGAARGAVCGPSRACLGKCGMVFLTLVCLVSHLDLLNHLSFVDFTATAIKARATGSSPATAASSPILCSRAHSCSSTASPRARKTRGSPPDSIATVSERSFTGSLSAGGRQVAGCCSSWSALGAPSR